MQIRNRLSAYLSEFEKGFDDSHAIRYLYKRDPLLWRDILEATQFLGEDALPKQRCWHVMNGIWERPICKYTGELVDWQGSRYRAFIGKGTNNSDPVHQVMKRQSCMTKYGVENPMQVSEFKERLAQTNIKKYGHSNVLASEYGITKVKEAWADPLKREARLGAIKNAFETKFGGYPYQNPAIFAKAMKNGFKYKPYTMPSGQVVQIQGYEDIALDELISSGIHEDYIKTAKNEVPEIWYSFEGRRRRYYPDIYITNENRIVEVKSSFSYKYELAKNEAKKEACISAGFLFEFRIYSSRPK